MSSPKKIGRWNRFEIAFNERKGPKPLFSPSALSRAFGETRGLCKIVKETPVEFRGELASPEKTTLSKSASSPTLWAETRREAQAAKKRRSRR